MCVCFLIHPHSALRQRFQEYLLLIPVVVAMLLGSAISANVENVYHTLLQSWAK